METIILEKLRIPYRETTTGCTEKNQIAQDNDKKEKVCPPGVTGLNAYYNCGKTCASTGMCDNKFQQIPRGGKDYCMANANDKDLLGLCCKNPIKTTDSDGNTTYMCCISDNCFNDTKYPYSKNILGIPGTTFATDNDKITFSCDLTFDGAITVGTNA